MKYGHSSVSDVTSLPVFEIQKLRRIYGPVKAEERRRIRNNDELEKSMDKKIE
jgi:hypothetical protein